MNNKEVKLNFCAISNFINYFIGEAIFTSFPKVKRE